MFLATFGHFLHTLTLGCGQICNFSFWGYMYMEVQLGLYRHVFSYVFWHKKSINTFNFNLKLCQMIFGHNY